MNRAQGSRTPLVGSSIPIIIKSRSAASATAHADRNTVCLLDLCLRCRTNMAATRHATGPLRPTISRARRPITRLIFGLPLLARGEGRQSARMSEDQRSARSIAAGGGYLLPPEGSEDSSGLERVDRKQKHHDCRNGKFDDPSHPSKSDIFALTRLAGNRCIAFPARLDRVVGAS